MEYRRVSERALKVEDERLCDYEMVLIFSPEVVEEDFDAAVDKVSQFIVGRGGAISAVEVWGKRRLAYPIKRFVEGSYVLVQFKMRTTLCRELEANLQISEEVLRHLLIRVGS